MRMKLGVAAAILSIALLAGTSSAGDKSTTVSGWVLDSACAFTHSLKKPISEKCALACANAGSPLVVMTDDGTIYWPIAGTTPSSGQNSRLIKFAAKKVTVTGTVYDRGGSHAIVIEKIEAQ
jgi:hypothetical protein